MTKGRVVLPGASLWLVERTAGPSTSLRFGRDDNSHFGRGFECPRKIVIPKKVTNSQDDDFVGVSAKNILNKLALMGLRPGLFSNFHAVPSGLPVMLELRSLPEGLKAMQRYAVAPSVPCGIPDPASTIFQVSSGFVESKGQPLERTNRNQPPAICEVITAVMTREV
jgi:hypothetical protein